MNRCKAFLESFKPDNHTAALIHRPENIRWLTGYTGEGSVFVSADAQVIITDFRYVEQADRQAPECVCMRTEAGTPERVHVKSLCEQHGITKLFVETDYLIYDDYHTLDSYLEGVELIPLNGVVQTLRMIKDAGEIECIRRAAAISCKALENTLNRVHVGMTEKQVQIMLDYEMLALGADGLGFSTIAAAGINGSLPHAVPSDYVIQSGDLLTLDFGARVNGYTADMTRTVGFGKIDSEKRELYNAVLNAQLMALEQVRPGAVCGDLDKIARDYLDARYPGAFGHSLGHGVGLFIHEQPRVARGSTTVLVPGHVITIEPGVYIPGLGGCRIEDMAIITSDGYIDPITAPKQLIEL